MSCKQLEKEVAIILGDMADARTRWMVVKELRADNETRGAAVRLAGLISPSF